MKNRNRTREPSHGIQHRAAWEHARKVLRTTEPTLLHNNIGILIAFETELELANGKPLKLRFKITQGLQIVIVGGNRYDPYRNRSSREEEIPFLGKSPYHRQLTPARRADARMSQYRNAAIARQQGESPLSFRHFNLLIAALSPTLT